MNNMYPSKLKELVDEATNTNLKGTKIQKYHDSVTQMLELNDLNLMEKAIVASDAHMGFVTCLFSERRLLKKLEHEKERLSLEYLAKYGKENTPKFKIQTEIDKQENIKKIDELIEEQKEIISFLMYTCETTKNFGFNIKSAVDLHKLAQ